MCADLRATLLTFFFLAGAVPLAGAEEPLPSLPGGPFNNEYTIEVKLDPSSMTLIGHEEVLFRNLSSTPVEEVPFHLYPNAWANTGTRWIRDGRDENEILKRGADNGGYMKITGVHDQKGTDLGKSTVIKETVMRIRLAEPLLKGGEVSFVIDWETRLPHIVARMGKYGQQVNAMQWFPKLAAHVDGQFVDWEFRNPSEFFANFGKYTVSITLPEKYKMGATGTLTEEPVTEGGLRTSIYEASAVHDFAWCANPNFIVHRDRTSTGTEIVLLSQPFMEPKAQLVLDATRFTIEKYAEWFFPYPYPKIVIDAEPHGSRGGMEYPMLFTISAGQPEFLSWIRERSEDPAGVTIHEFNHQYWYGLLASNEFEEAWLDEGFTTYMTYKTMDEFFRGRAEGPGLPILATNRVYQPLLEHGSLLETVAGWKQSPFTDRYREDRETFLGFYIPRIQQTGSFNNRFYGRKSSYAPFADQSPLHTVSWEVYGARGDNAYRSIAYSKPALMLRTLEGQIGWEAMRKLLATWTRRYAFKHPTSEDFIAVANEELDGRFHDFLLRCIYGSEHIDYAVEEARCYSVEEGVGYSTQEVPGEEITSNFKEPEPEETAWDRFWNFFGEDDGPPDEDGEEHRLYASEVVVKNLGTLWLPTTVELLYEDGVVQHIELSEEKTWYRLQPDPRPSRLVSARVDPERIIALDLNVTNNGRLVRRDRAAARTGGVFFQFWIQGWLSGISWFS